MQISLFERLKSVGKLKLKLETTFNFLYTHRWLGLKKKSESSIKYYIKVTCALK